jgi:hypothetical protein
VGRQVKTERVVEDVGHNGRTHPAKILDRSNPGPLEILSTHLVSSRSWPAHRASVAAHYYGWRLNAQGSPTRCAFRDTLADAVSSWWKLPVHGLVTRIPMDLAMNGTTAWCLPGSEVRNIYLARRNSYRLTERRFTCVCAPKSDACAERRKGSSPFPTS